MKFTHCLLILAASVQIANANENMTGRYTLPPSKVYIESCGRKALLSHPGMIEKQRILHRHGDFWVRYEIQEQNSSEWLVLCSLVNGSIIREQQLIDDAR